MKKTTKDFVWLFILGTILNLLTSSLVLSREYNYLDINDLKNSEPPIVAGNYIMVTTTSDSLADDGFCSLREAIRNASENRQVDNDDCRSGVTGNDVINLSEGTYAFTLPGQGEDKSETGDLDVSGVLTIDGKGSDKTIIDAKGLDMVFEMERDSTVIISNLTITGGYNSSPLVAGGIFVNYDATVSLNDVVVDSNSGYGAAIENNGTLTVENSIISNNIGDNDTGGIANNSGGNLTLKDSTISSNWGENVGGLRNYGTMILEGVTISENSADDGPGGIINDTWAILTLNETTVSDNDGWASGGIFNSGDLTINSSTISGNEGKGLGGGIVSDGASTLTLNNSTISGNIATHDASAGGIYAESSVVIKSSTIAFNTGGYVGGLYIPFGVKVGNTLVANNISTSIISHTDDSHADCIGTIDTINYSLIEKNGCNFDSKTVLTEIDPDLQESLELHSGTTRTHKLKSTSPAIDAGNPSGCTDADGALLTTDQRGKTRTVDGDGDGNAICDIGAYERQR